MFNNICENLNEWYALAEDVYPFTVGLITFLCVSLLPTFVLNALILATIVRQTALHTPSNIFTCNLAAANLGVVLVTVPLLIAWKLMELNHHYQRYTCDTSMAAFILGCLLNGASYLTVVFATVDRYLALFFHLRYRSLVTIKRVAMSCILIWIISALQIFTLYNGPEDFFSIVIGTSMTLLLIMMAVCYAKIFRIIRQHHNQIQHQVAHTTAAFQNQSHSKRYRKSVLNLFYVMCCQLLFMAPIISCLAILATSGVSLAILRFWNVGIGLVLLNPLVNPLLIYMGYGELRLAVKETAHSCWLRIKQVL